MEQEAEDRQSVKVEESRSQEQTRRLQWQVRELEEEMADMRRKESESSQRKQDMVGLGRSSCLSHALTSVFTATFLTLPYLRGGCVLATQR